MLRAIQVRLHILICSFMISFYTILINITGKLEVDEQSILKVSESSLRIAYDWR